MATELRPATRRIGRFRIDADLLVERPAIATRIMGQCVIWRAEMLFAERVVEYSAECFRFDEVAEGNVMPEYRWYSHDNGEVLPHKVRVPNYSREDHVC